MSTLTETAPEQNQVEERKVPVSKGRLVVNWITSTDHKTIGYMYLIASFIFFCLGGVMALLIRAELFEPGMQILQTKEQYNQLFTMHGTIMLLMFATPLFAGFTNVIMPLQIGAPDVAFPRLNALAFWFFLFGSTIAVSGFVTPQGAASFGWFAYAPLGHMPEAFAEAMDDDLNIPKALAVLHERVRSGNAALADDENEATSAALLAVLAMTDALGLSSVPLVGSADNQSAQALESLVQARLADRAAARAEKNWARSDEIRDELAEAGIKIEDSSNGATWSIERKQQR